MILALGVMLAGCGVEGSDDVGASEDFPQSIGIDATFRESNHPDGAGIHCSTDGGGAHISGLPNAPDAGSEPNDCLAPATLSDGVWTIRCEFSPSRWREFHIHDDLMGGDWISSDITAAIGGIAVCQDFFDIASITKIL